MKNCRHKLWKLLSYSLFEFVYELDYYEATLVANELLMLSLSQILSMYSLASLPSSIYPLPAMHLLLVKLYVTEYSQIKYIVSSCCASWIPLILVTKHVLAFLKQRNARPNNNHLLTIYQGVHITHFNFQWMLWLSHSLRLIKR